MAEKLSSLAHLKRSTKTQSIRTRRDCWNQFPPWAETRQSTSKEFRQACLTSRHGADSWAGVLRQLKNASSFLPGLKPKQAMSGAGCTNRCLKNSWPVSFKRLAGFWQYPFAQCCGRALACCAGQGLHCDFSNCPIFLNGDSCSSFAASCNSALVPRAFKL